MHCIRLWTWVRNVFGFALAVTLRRVTGTTFGYVMAYITKKQPALVILEDVIDLAEGGEDARQSCIP